MLVIDKFCLYIDNHSKLSKKSFMRRATEKMRNRSDFCGLFVASFQKNVSQSNYSVYSSAKSFSVTSQANVSQSLQMGESGESKDEGNTSAQISHEIKDNIVKTSDITAESTDSNSRSTRNSSFGIKVTRQPITYNNSSVDLLIKNIEHKHVTTDNRLFTSVFKDFSSESLFRHTSNSKQVRVVPLNISTNQTNC